MNKKIFPLLVLCSTFLSCTNTNAKWVEYRVPGVCSFSAPPSLTLMQNGDMFNDVRNSSHEPYKEWSGEGHDLFNDRIQFTFAPNNSAPKDLNSDNPFYSFPMIKISFSMNKKSGEHYIRSLSDEDFKSIDNYACTTMAKQFEDARSRYTDPLKGQFEWHTSTFQIIDNIPCMILDMKRPSYGASGYDRVYQFDKGLYHVAILISYSEKENEKVKEQIDNFMQHFHFEEIFKQCQYKTAPSHLLTYESKRFNINYTYDANEYKITKKGEDCLIELQSKYNDWRKIMLVAYEGKLISKNDIYGEEIKTFFIEMDKKSTKGEILESCSEVIIGDGIKSLRTISRTPFSGDRLYMYSVAYIFSNNYEMQYLRVMISEEEYQNWEQIEQEVTQGLSYIN